MSKVANMIVKRNLLCIKSKRSLKLGQILLYEPYKNILANFKDLCININAKNFDPVAKVYDGLLSTPPEIREYYEALLGVTSYYQHSQGGKGKYIEKKLASSFETCSLSIEISKLPLWLTYPKLYRKKGIFTQQGLSEKEKNIFRTIEWDWIGDMEKDINVDVGNIIKNENTIVLMEIKNRVDSGGTAARREIWTSEKFGIFVEYLNSNEKIFRKKDKEFSFVELLEHFDISNFELYIGILFDKSDNPATVETDKSHGFFSSSKRGFGYLKNLIKKSTTINIVKEDSENLQMELSLTYSDLRVKIGAAYGNDIPSRLFRKSLSISNLLLLQYDDIWLSQLITINERTILLKNRKNYTTTFLDLLKRDRNLRIMYNNLIKSECEKRKLKNIINYLFAKYSVDFDNILLPKGKDKKGYLADIIQVLCAYEA